VFPEPNQKRERSFFPSNDFGRRMLFPILFAFALSLTILSNQHQA
jgi:hypothetical protein